MSNINVQYKYFFINYKKWANGQLVSDLVESLVLPKIIILTKFPIFRILIDFSKKWKRFCNDVLKKFCKFKKTEIFYQC